MTSPLDAAFDTDDYNEYTYPEHNTLNSLRLVRQFSRVSGAISSPVWESLIWCNGNWVKKEDWLPAVVKVFPCKTSGQHNTQSYSKMAVSECIEFHCESSWYSTWVRIVYFQSKTEPLSLLPFLFPDHSSLYGTSVGFRISLTINLFTRCDADSDTPRVPIVGKLIWD